MRDAPIPGRIVKLLLIAQAAGAKVSVIDCDYGDGGHVNVDKLSNRSLHAAMVREGFREHPGSKDLHWCNADHPKQSIQISRDEVEGIIAALRTVAMPGVDKLLVRLREALEVEK